jgi:hypothetical protein
MSTAGIFLRIAFVVAPAIVLSGLLVYWGRNALVAHGVEVNEHLYFFVAFAVVWAAQAVTTQPILAELRRRKLASKQRPSS